MATPIKKLSIPKGWTKQEIRRANGTGVGKIDFYIKSPNGNIFRSKKSLLSYLQKNKLPYKVEDFFENSETKSFPLHNQDQNKTIEKGNEEESRTRVNLQTETKTDKDTFLEKVVNTQTDVTINTAIMCEEILSKQWISDETLQNYFEILNTKFLNDKDVSIMNPVISQAIKKCEHYEHFLEALEIKNRHILIIPVNDSENTQTEGGTHWSLLVFSKATQDFYYYDSNKNSNLEHANTIKVKLSKYLDIAHEKPIITCGTTQQINGYDCAIYSIFIIEHIIYNITYMEVMDWDTVGNLKPTQTALINKRALLAYIIFNRCMIRKETVYDLMFHHCIYNQKKKTKLSKINQNVEKTNNLHGSANLLKKNEVYENELLILADSQGRNLTKYISSQWPCNKTRISSLFKPNAVFSEVVKDVGKLTKSFTKKDYVIVLAGSNDDIMGYQDKLIKDMDHMLKQTVHTNIIVAGLPYRHHSPGQNNRISYINMEIEQLIKKSQHGTLLPINYLPRHLYTKHGLHFNQRGKRKIADMVKEVLFPKSLVIPSKNKQPSPFVEKSINIVEANMSKTIDDFRRDPSVAFAHCISGDLTDKRNMTAGVAVAFRRAVGRPSSTDYVGSRLTCQAMDQGATVYSLVTKEIYSGKPTKEDYNTAFEQLTDHFKATQLKTLICSPMGCVRDHIKPEQFVTNLYNFFHATGATVIVIAEEQDSHRVLRNTLSHSELLTALQEEVNKCLINSSGSKQSNSEELRKENNGIGKIPVTQTKTNTDKVTKKIIQNCNLPCQSSTPRNDPSPNLSNTLYIKDDSSSFLDLTVFPPLI